MRTLYWMDTTHSWTWSQVKIQTDLAWEKNKHSLTRYLDYVLQLYKIYKNRWSIIDKVKIYKGMYMYYTQWATGTHPVAIMEAIKCCGEAKEVQRWNTQGSSDVSQKHWPPKHTKGCTSSTGKDTHVTSLFRLFWRKVSCAEMSDLSSLVMNTIMWLVKIV